MPNRAPHKPFLLLSIRAEEQAADEEYAAMLRFGGLDENGLVRVRMSAHGQLGLDLPDWSGIILGGGSFNISDPVAEKSADQLDIEDQLAVILDDIVALDFPFLGCCYGIGTLGTHVGAFVDRTFGEPVGAVPVSLTPAGRADALFAGVPDTFAAFVGHKEAIRLLPPEIVVLASSPTCPVQAFRVGDNVYATQFHPELDTDGLCTRIDVYQDYGYFDPADADGLKARARTAHVAHPMAVLRNFVDRFAVPVPVAAADPGRPQWLAPIAPSD